jgi:hypothetical protein
MLSIFLLQAITCYEMKPSEQPILYFSSINFLSVNTGNMDCWNEAINVLRTVKFSNEKREFVPPSITNLDITSKEFETFMEEIASCGF